MAVCAAKHLPQARVTAIDISPAALAVARENAAAHGVAERIEFVESDLFAALPAEQQFDFIVSNPPYVTIGRAGAAVARRAGLRAAAGAGRRPAGDGGHRAAAAAGRRAAVARRLAADGDRPDDRAAVRELIAADGNWELVATKKDLAGHARVIVARRKPAT